MTSFSPPPPGYEVVEADEDEDHGVATEDTVRFRSPDGEVLTLAQMIERGLMDG